MSTDWITWALQGLMGFLLVIVWQKLDETSKAINALALRIAESYVRFEHLKPVVEQMQEIERWRAGTVPVLDMIKNRLERDK